MVKRIGIRAEDTHRSVRATPRVRLDGLLLTGCSRKASARMLTGPSQALACTCVASVTVVIHSMDRFGHAISVLTESGSFAS